MIAFLGRGRSGSLHFLMRSAGVPLAPFAASRLAGGERGGVRGKPRTSRRYGRGCERRVCARRGRPPAALRGQESQQDPRPQRGEQGTSSASSTGLAERHRIWPNRRPVVHCGEPFKSPPRSHFRGAIIGYAEHRSSPSRRLAVWRCLSLAAELAANDAGKQARLFEAEQVDQREVGAGPEAARHEQQQRVTAGMAEREEGRREPR